MSKWIILALVILVLGSAASLVVTMVKVWPIEKAQSTIPLYLDVYHVFGRVHPEVVEKRGKPVFYQVFTMVSEAQALDIPWNLVLGKNYIESRFDPNAVSESGAMGLSQLMEETDRMMCQKTGIPYDSGRTAFNDNACIIKGASYLSEGYEEEDHDAEDALKYYIAGPDWKNKMKKWKHSKVKKELAFYTYVTNYVKDVARESKQFKLVYDVMLESRDGSIPEGR